MLNFLICLERRGRGQLKKSPPRRLRKLMRQGIQVRSQGQTAKIVATCVLTLFLAVPSPVFHFLANLQWKNVEFLPRMKVGDNVFVCTGTKNGVECGFALCYECKQRCSSGRGSLCSRGGASTTSSSLTDDEKNLLTGCHSDHSRL